MGWVIARPGGVTNVSGDFKGSTPFKAAYSTRVSAVTLRVFLTDSEAFFVGVQCTISRADSSSHVGKKVLPVTP